MSKTDLRARPIFARTRDAIEAHLTMVFTALAVSRTVQNRTGLSFDASCAPSGHCARRPSKSTASRPPSHPRSAPPRPQSSTRCKPRPRGTKAFGPTQGLKPALVKPTVRRTESASCSRQVRNAGLLVVLPGYGAGSAPGSGDDECWSMRPAGDHPEPERMKTFATLR